MRTNWSSCNRPSAITQADVLYVRSGKQGERERVLAQTRACDELGGRTYTRVNPHIPTCTYNRTTQATRMRAHTHACKDSGSQAAGAEARKHARTRAHLELLARVLGLSEFGSSHRAQVLLLCRRANFVWDKEIMEICLSGA